MLVLCPPFWEIDTFVSFLTKETHFFDIPPASLLLLSYAISLRISWAYAVQESMINEPPSGWHRIHLTSTTLHRIGIGVFIDSNGWVWFTEDMVS